MNEWWLIKKLGVIAGVIASIAIIFPTGDLHGKYVARNQPVAIAAMEGLFKSEVGAGIVLMGQPNEETGLIDNPLVVNNVLYAYATQTITSLVRLLLD